MSEEDIRFCAYWNTAQPLARFKRDSGLLHLDQKTARAFREEVELAFKEALRQNHKKET